MCGTLTDELSMAKEWHLVNQFDTAVLIWCGENTKLERHFCSPATKKQVDHEFQGLWYTGCNNVIKKADICNSTYS